MATRIPTEHRAMRKRPKQQRSQSTVESIVEAGARVLAQRGWANFTTNEVAHTAGVSIGSLYQYFPNKLAIAEAVRKRHLDEIGKRVNFTEQFAYGKWVNFIIRGEVWERHQLANCLLVGKGSTSSDPPRHLHKVG